MLRFLLLLLLVIAEGVCFSFAQTPEQILQKLKEGDIDFVIKNSAFPFCVQFSLDTCFQKKTDALYKELKKISTDFTKISEVIHDSELEIIWVFRSFDENHELMAESSLAFFFIKTKKSKPPKLYRIQLAG